MAEIVVQGHQAWQELVGKEVSFLWSDGWEEAWTIRQIVAGTQVYEEDPRYPRYYVLDPDGGGFSFWEDEPVEVTLL
jgi:hypothetical protein